MRLLCIVEAEEVHFHTLVYLCYRFLLVHSHLTSPRLQYFWKESNQYQFYSSVHSLHPFIASIMTSGNIMFSLRALPLLLILSLLVPSEARVGSSKQATDSDSSIRKLAGQYNRPAHPPANHNGHNYYQAKHYGHYDYYYIKRPVDPSEYYHNYKPASEPTTNNRQPTVRPTNAPMPVATVPQPVAVVPPPTFKPTTPPIPQPSITPTDSPVVEIPETLSPTVTPVPPPSFMPAILVGVVDQENVTKPDIDIIDGPEIVIDFEEPTPIQLRLADFALGGGEEFTDRSSYQFAALKRVEQQVGAEDMSDVKLLQYYVLYCVFESTHAKTNEMIKQSRAFGDDEADIPGWKITSGWMENDLDPCIGEWYGIVCDEDQIINVDLFDNGLTGNFAPEIKLLAGDGFYSTGAGNLISLDIFNNQMMSNNGDNSWIADLGSQLGEYTRQKVTWFDIYTGNRNLDSILIYLLLVYLLLSLFLQDTFTCKTLVSRADSHPNSRKDWSNWTLPIP